MGIILPISSDWTNVINSVIFEVVLITLIFFLTADVCARLNYLTLADGSSQELVVISPPLLGGGLISTSRRRTLFMIALRGLGIFLIFGTALTIDGESVEVKKTSTKMVFAPADFSNATTSSKALKGLANLRYTCMTNIHNSMVFGRLDKDGYCETNIDFLHDAIRINVTLKPTSVSFSGGCQYTQVPVIVGANNSVLKHVITTCEKDGRKASVFCHHKTTQDKVDWTICAASFKLNAKRFVVCEEFDQLVAGAPFSIKADCHEATNLDAVLNLWPKAMTITRTYGIINMIAAVSVIGKQRRRVTRLERFDGTDLNEMWFLCLAIKLLVVVVLAVLSIQLRVRGTKRVLNDDRALLSLLRLKLDDWIGLSNARDPPTLYLHLRTSGHREGKVWASTMPNYNAPTSNSESEK